MEPMDDAFLPRSMLDLSHSAMEDIETLAESQYTWTIPWSNFQATKSGAALQALKETSKNLIVYMEGLLAMSPYVNGPFDSRTKGVAEAEANKASKCSTI
jgi:calcineurin-like phosphoesterase